ncbi:hypothetical protein JW796_02975 [Candidatus Dojkabacteria bacterium]|nr:hypothetical protein [Candidatus Dojkabacteria bacterium]
MEQQDTNKDFIKNLQHFAPKYCDNCGHAFSEIDFKVLKRSNMNTLLHLRCSSCGSAYMLNVLSPAQGVTGSTRVPVNLDLSSGEEIKKFAGTESISENNAIDAYEALADLDLEEKLKNRLGT